LFGNRRTFLVWTFGILLVLTLVIVIIWMLRDRRKVGFLRIDRQSKYSERPLTMHAWQDVRRGELAQLHLNDGTKGVIIGPARLCVSRFAWTRDRTDGDVHLKLSSGTLLLHAPEKARTLNQRVVELPLFTADVRKGRVGLHVTTRKCGENIAVSLMDESHRSGQVCIRKECRDLRWNMQAYRTDGRHHCSIPFMYSTEARSIFDRCDAFATMNYLTAEAYDSTNGTTCGVDSDPKLDAFGDDEESIERRAKQPTLPDHTLDSAGDRVVRPTAEHADARRSFSPAASTGSRRRRRDRRTRRLRLHRRREKRIHARRRRRESITTEASRESSLEQRAPDAPHRRPTEVIVALPDSRLSTQITESPPRLKGRKRARARDKPPVHVAAVPNAGAQQRTTMGSQNVASSVTVIRPSVSDGMPPLSPIIATLPQPPLQPSPLQPSPPTPSPTPTPPLSHQSIRHGDVVKMRTSSGSYCTFRTNADGSTRLGWNGGAFDAAVLRIVVDGRDDSNASLQGADVGKEILRTTQKPVTHFQLLDALSFLPLREGIGLSSSSSTSSSTSSSSCSDSAVAADSSSRQPLTLVSSSDAILWTCAGGVNSSSGMRLFEPLFLSDATRTMFLTSGALGAGLSGGSKLGGGVVSDSLTLGAGRHACMSVSFELLDLSQRDGGTRLRSMQHVCSTGCS
jgi:hypothetical protein